MVIIFRGICIVTLLDYGFCRMAALGTKVIFLIICSQLLLGKTTNDKSTAENKSVIEEEEIYFVKKKQIAYV